MEQSLVMDEAANCTQHFSSNTTKERTRFSKDTYGLFHFKSVKIQIDTIYCPPQLLNKMLIGGIFPVGVASVVFRRLKNNNKSVGAFDNECHQRLPPTFQQQPVTFLVQMIVHITLFTKKGKSIFFTLES